MAVIVYADLFDRLKVLIKYFNELETRQVGTGATNLPLPYIKNQVLTPFEAQALTAQLPTLEADFEAAVLSVGSLKLSFISWFENVLAGASVSLGVHSSAAIDILSTLALAMTRDSQTINAREMAVTTSDIHTDGTIKSHTANVGNGRLVYTFIRPGLSPSEIVNVEVLQCQCISTSSPRQELFQLSGEERHGRESHRGQGSGLGPTLTTLGESVLNGDFEDWTGTPKEADNWVIAIGAWGTELLQEVTTLYEGTYSVKTVYAEGDWKITHALPVSLQPNTLYVVTLAARKVTGATGTLRFGISNGTAKDAFVTGCVKSIDVSALTTSYALQYLAFKTPTSINSAWTLGISMDTPGVADIYFDTFQFGAMTKFNNMYFATIAGNTNFGMGDEFGFGSENVGFEITESQPGVIQKFIGRCFDIQLPSATGGTESISDPA